MRSLTRLTVLGGEERRHATFPGMHLAFAAAACCIVTATPPPLAQSWADTGMITADDDWSRVPAIVGLRGDGMVAEPGVDPRTVLADGSATPVDVTANRADPGAVGLAAGIAEFELPNPVVAIAGSAAAAAPHLVVALDTRGRSGITVRFLLRDVDGSATDAVQPVALQYRVGESGEFGNAPGGYVADATGGPSEATRVTEVRTVLPAAVDDQPLVQIRMLTTNADGRDEWVGVDDIEVSATAVAAPGGGCVDGDPLPSPAPAPPPSPPPPPPPSPPPPAERHPELTELELVPDTFTPAKRGPAIVRRGRAGAGLRFRLSSAALVRFRVWGWGRGATRALGRRWPTLVRGRFQVRGRRGLNRMRFTGRLRGRPLPDGNYVLEAVATDRAGRTSAPAAILFRTVARR
jgi:hypothetical protein